MGAVIGVQGENVILNGKVFATLQVANNGAVQGFGMWRCMGLAGGGVRWKAGEQDVLWQRAGGPSQPAAPPPAASERASKSELRMEDVRAEWEVAWASTSRMRRRENSDQQLQFFLQYASPATMGPVVTGNGLIQLFEDLEIDPAADPVALAVVAKFKCATMGTITLVEWANGCRALGLKDITDLRDRIEGLRAEISNLHTMDDVYGAVFGMALDPGCRVLPKDEALAYWGFFLEGRWGLFDKWRQFLLEVYQKPSINKDCWLEVLKLARDYPDDLSTFDDRPDWPVILDDFAEWVRE